MTSHNFKSAHALVAIVLGSFLLPSAGCYYPADVQPGYPAQSSGSYVPAPEPGVPTSLVVVVEGESTEAQYEAHRREIIDYLIDRGYINSESDLIADPDDAERIIRAIVSGDGFTISVFDKDTQAGPPPDLEDSDLLYPEDPYFIWGFLYAGEIGLRHLPPRPPNYRPHPWPRHHGPPPGHPIYDQNRHWSRSNPPGNANHPHPVQSGNPPGNRPPRPEDRGNPGDHGRPDEHGRPDNNAHPANTNSPENHGRSTPSQPVAPQAQGSNGQHGPPSGNSSRNAPPMQSHQTGSMPSHNAPPPRSAPPPMHSQSAPMRSAPPAQSAPPPAPPPAQSAPPSAQSAPPSDSHRQQN